MILFEWGTYNALSTLKQAALLGTRITEIPPAVLSRRLPSGYYESYKRLGGEYFTSILAHGPYYSLTSEKGLKAHLSAIEKATLCGAEIYNYHLGRRVGDDLNVHLDILKKFSEVNNEMIYSPEPAANIGEFGTLDELEELIKAAKEEDIKIIPSLQLENIFLNELGVYEKDDLDEAAEKADVDWWLNIFKRMDKISDYIMHFRFSQVIGLRYGNRFYKKRVPLGKGYPPIEPLTEALSTYLVENATRGGFKRVLFVYTGLPEVKYRDLIDLYAMIMKKSVDKLMSKESQVEYGDFYKFMKSEDEE
jgi:sugar phosphate isomerase/epimerase